MKTLHGFVIGMCLAGVVNAAAVAETAPAGAGCNVACSNAAAVLASPHTSFEMAVVNQDNNSTLYVTWTSKDNLDLAPAKYKGVLHANLHSTKLKEVRQSSSGDGCTVVVEVMETTKKGAKSYSVPMRNVLCGSEAEG